MEKERTTSHPMKKHPDQRYGNISYAQHGDDFMLLSLVECLELDQHKDKPLWLDIGAHHPSVISNTKLLYDEGFFGVNIEANPLLINNFLIDRKRDLTFQLGIGTKEETADLYMYGDLSGRNTFSRDEVKAMEGFLTVKKTISVKMTTLNKFVNEFLGGVFPPFLLVDAEGMDYEILENSLTSWWKGPLVVVVETRRGSPAKKMYDLMLSRGYLLSCRMGENLFFFREDCLLKFL